MLSGIVQCCPLAGRIGRSRRCGPGACRVGSVPGDHAAVKTHEQPSSGPDEATLALQHELADLMKRDSPTFVAVVRHADQLAATGTARNDAYRLALTAAAKVR